MCLKMCAHRGRTLILVNVAHERPKTHTHKKTFQRPQTITCFRRPHTLKMNVRASKNKAWHYRETQGWNGGSPFGRNWKIIVFVEWQKYRWVWYPASHWQEPSTASQNRVPSTLQSHFCLQSLPNQNNGQGVLQAAPVNPGLHLHEPNIGWHLQPFH